MGVGVSGGWGVVYIRGNCMVFSMAGMLRLRLRLVCCVVVVE